MVLVSKQDFYKPNLNNTDMETDFKSIYGFQNIEKYDIPIEIASIRDIFTCGNVIFYVTNESVCASICDKSDEYKIFGNIGKYLSDNFYVLMLPDNFMKNTYVKKITYGICRLIKHFGFPITDLHA